MTLIDPMLSVENLDAVMASDPDLVVLDVRWSLTGPPGRSRYDEGHLPGASFIDLEHELAGPAGAAGRHPLPFPEVFAAAMRRVGVSADSRVVVYDEQDGWAAARAWWCLRYFGHPQVEVLDGGFRAWVAAGGPVVIHEPSPVPGDFVARPGGMLLSDAEDAARIVREGVLLDARTGERYRGEVEPVDPVAGHIPGAINLPAHESVGPNHRLLSRVELRERFAALGVDEASPVGCYCGSGVSAAHQVLALHRAGIPAALYVGSWSHWSADPTRKVATEESPSGSSP